MLCPRPLEGDLLVVLDLTHCHPCPSGEVTIFWRSHSSNEPGPESEWELGNTARGLWDRQTYRFA